MGSVPSPCTPPRMPDLHFLRVRTAVASNGNTIPEFHCALCPKTFGPGMPLNIITAPGWVNPSCRRGA